MSTDNATNVMGVALRVTRLNSDGTIASGASAAYVSKKFVSIGFTPEFESGDELNLKAADGTIGATWKSPDSIKRFTVNLTLVDPDPELTEILSGGTILSTAGANLGWAAPALGVNATPNGCAIEVWSYANVSGRPSATNPYWRHVLPQAYMRLNGERLVGNNIMGVQFTGYSIGNPGFGTGPGAPTWPYTTNSGWAYARATSIPAGSGYQTV